MTGNSTGAALRAAFILVAVMALSLCARGQGVYVNLPPITDAMGHPIAGATVSVFSASGNAGSLSCNTPANIYLNSSLTTPINASAPNTTVTDGFGNFPFYIGASTTPMGYMVSGQNTDSSICYGFTPNGGSGSFATLGVTGNATIGGTLGVTGLLSAVNVVVSGALTVIGNSTFGGPSPWIDVTSSTYGAKCDNSTDDTAAIQAALNASSSTGGVCAYIPAGKMCKVASTIDMHQKNNWCLRSDPVALQFNSGTGINYTGSSAPFLDMQSTTGVTIAGLILQYTNSSFTGRFIDAQHSSGADTEEATFQNDIIGGTSATVNGATCLLCLDNSDLITIDSVGFVWAQNGISAPNSNSVEVRGHSFFGLAGATGVMPGAAISNPGTKFNVASGVFFEIGDTTENIVDCTNGGGGNLSFSGTVGDAPASWAGTVFKNIGHGGISGLNVTGGVFVGGTSKLATFLSTTNSIFRGITVIGNTVQNFATGFSFNGGEQDVVIHGNYFDGSTTTFMVNSPKSGYIKEDVFNNGQGTFYGPNGLIASMLVASGTAAGLTGTGACATITTQSGGSWAGTAKCTGTTGASTLTITPGATAPNGWICNVQDETTRANLFQQTSHTQTTCVLTVTSVTQNDVFVFSAIAF